MNFWIISRLRWRSGMPSKQTQMHAGMIHVYTPIMRLPFEFTAERTLKGNRAF